MYIITIDGPASSGKSTVASIVAEKLKIAHINSGEAYRAIAYFMLKNGISPSDKENIDICLNNNSFKMEYLQGKQILSVNGEDITQYLHTNEINSVVSKYGTNPKVIYASSDMARQLAQNMSVVMDGRNLGSFCFPDARYKFYVDCDEKERAIRRFNEMKQKGTDVDFDEILKQVIDRDKLDKTREIAPLVVPNNAIMLDSTNQTPEQVAQKIVDIVLENEKIDLY